MDMEKLYDSVYAAVFARLWSMQISTSELQEAASRAAREAVISFDHAERLDAIGEAQKD